MRDWMRNEMSRENGDEGIPLVVRQKVSFASSKLIIESLME